MTHINNGILQKNNFLKSYKWIKISLPLDDLNFLVPKNEVRTINAAGKEFCVGHVEDGLFALQNSCPHASGPLGEGEIDANGNVVCPFHHYKFNLRTGKNTSGEGFYANNYPIEIRKDGIYLGIPEKRWFSFF